MFSYFLTGFLFIPIGFFGGRPTFDPYVPLPFGMMYSPISAGERTIPLPRRL